ncbi:hypothetical protein AYO49_04795 [Verrucomicrobiaceae bacterium SCGC AG-212-N21]|nr:hypothetical protein AYO49_04795 [Verrucomicrobiaceae bacterium SCGC AG-212-N21]
MAVMRRVRKTIFWLHLSAGLTAGVFIPLMGITGVLLAYERQILAWQDGYEVEVSAGQGARPLEEIVAKVMAAHPGAPLSGIARETGAGELYVFSFGKEKQFFVDPYAGDVLGEGSPKLRGFFAWVTGLHRWLALSQEQRKIGTNITGTAALFFFFLVVSGLIVWWPRRWTWHHLKRIVLFQPRLHGPARDWNWHNVLGFWCCIPLTIITLSGAVIAFEWANNLLFRAAGSEPPPAKSMSSGGGGGGGTPVSLAGLDRAWALAESKAPQWESISVRLPAKAGDAALFTISESHRGRPDLKASLSVDLATGQEKVYETFDGYSRGRQWRLWARWLHTGEAGGVWGQTLALFAAGGAVFLVWTGSALAWRRFRRRA